MSRVCAYESAAIATDFNGITYASARFPVIRFFRAMTLETRITEKRAITRFAPDYFFILIYARWRDVTTRAFFRATMSLVVSKASVARLAVTATRTGSSS